MSKRLLIGIALVVMSVSVVGAASYTSASVDRDASIGVSTDNSAIIGLEAGDVSGISNNASGYLDIELGQTNGLNSEASFVYGDSGDYENTNAFAITNNDGSNAHDFTLSYTIDGGDPSTADNVQFQVYSTSGSLGTATESSPLTVTDIGGGQTVYVIVTVDTTGVATTGDLSGTLTISAS